MSKTQTATDYTKNPLTMSKKYATLYGAFLAEGTNYLSESIGHYNKTTNFKREHKNRLEELEQESKKDKKYKNYINKIKRITNFKKIDFFNFDKVLNIYNFYKYTMEHEEAYIKKTQKLLRNNFYKFTQEQESKKMQENTEKEKMKKLGGLKYFEYISIFIESTTDKEKTLINDYKKIDELYGKLNKYYMRAFKGKIYKAEDVIKIGKIERKVIKELYKIAYDVKFTSYGETLKTCFYKLHNNKH